MAALTYSDLSDLITATLKQDVKDKVTNIDPNLLREYVGYRMLILKNKAVTTYNRAYRWTLNAIGTSPAEHIGPYATINFTQSDHLIQAEMQCKMTRKRWAMDLMEEDLNSGKNQIVNIIRHRDQQAQIAVVKTLETRIFSYADTTDPLAPQGLLYYLPYGATEGFNGTTSGSHTDVAGINPSTYTGWKSYTAQYVGMTEDDLWQKMRTAAEKTKFESPLDNMLIGAPMFGSSNKALFTTLTVRQEAEDYAKSQNDSVGFDVDAAYGRAMFRGTPLTAVPTWDDNTRHPVLAVDFSIIRWVNQEGWWMRRMTLDRNPNQPLVVNTDVYVAGNMICYDRRTAGFNIAKA